MVKHSYVRAEYVKGWGWLVHGQCKLIMHSLVVMPVAVWWAIYYGRYQNYSPLTLLQRQASSERLPLVLVLIQRSASTIYFRPTSFNGRFETRPYQLPLIWWSFTVPSPQNPLVLLLLWLIPVLFDHYGD